MITLQLTSQKIILLAAGILLLTGNIFLGLKYYTASNQAELAARCVANSEQSLKSLEFLKFFVAKVINAQGEVNFDDRLKMEVLIREIGDKTVTTQWENFLQGQNSDKAQTALKNLLENLIRLVH